MGNRSLALLLAGTVMAACSQQKTPAPPGLTRVKTDRTYLRDAHGRYVSLHGVNVGGGSKVPASFDEKKVPSYVGRPFAREEAAGHFRRLQQMGFSAVRLLVLWEGLEPSERGRYDRAYINYVREMVELAGDHGLYVLLDMHQDVFSRHLMVRFNDRPKYGKPGSLENTLFALLPPYSESVQGDGAPRWAVEACLPEKDLSSPNWGTPRILGGLDEPALLNIYNLFVRLNAGQPAQPGSIDWIVAFLKEKPAPFPPNESTDLLPFTNWSVAHALSLDVARAYACFFAGNEVFPGLKKDGKPVEELLQQAYADAWAALASEVADLPNVLGYDLMNEPSGNFIVLAAAAAMKNGGIDAVRGTLLALAGQELGEQLFKLVTDLRVLPPDTKPETLRLYGLDMIDASAALALNYGFDENHLRPFYERVGKAILAVDPDAVFFFESSTSAQNLFGGALGGIGGQWEVAMRRPELPQVVYAPHHYQDIYPFIGFNQAPRPITATQIRYRDYVPALEHAARAASRFLGNPPVVFGEFGTYFNFGGIYMSRQEEYVASSHLLDNYYEAFEQTFSSRMLWCYSPENDYKRGDGWNREDFSIIDPDQKPRSELAWSRPHARALAGKPIETHFYSHFHYFDPDKGTVDPEREFFVRYGSRETAAPTEIVVPEVQYPDGFYVWLSDGHCYFDPATRTLFHYPSDDAPGAEHWVRLLPPLEGREYSGWRYFFVGERVVAKD